VSAATGSYPGNDDPRREVFGSSELQYPPPRSVRLFLAVVPGKWIEKIENTERLQVDRRGGSTVSVEERVIEIVSEQMGVSKDQVTRETSFVNDLGADSLDTVELVMEFEEEFDITIPDEEAEKIQTVGQAIDYIEQHAHAK